MRKKNYSIIKYNNVLNEFAWGLSAVQMNYFVILLVILRNVKARSVKVSFWMIKKLADTTNSTSNKKLMQQLTDLLETLKTVATPIRQYGKPLCFNIFSVFKIDEESKTLEVGLNDSFFYVVNRFDRYTTVDLDVFLSLKSKYAKSIYRQLCSWASTGIWSVTIQKFRKTIDVPDNYTMKKITAKIINPAIDELNDYFHDLEVEYMYVGNKVVRITFKNNGYKYHQHDDSSDINADFTIEYIDNHRAVKRKVTRNTNELNTIIEEHIKDELRDNLETYVKQITTPTSYKNKFVCPLCHSKKTPAFSLYEKNGVKRWTCFSCNKSGDLYDLIGEVENITDFKDQVNRAMELFL